MRSDNVVFAVAGILFGLIAGWIIGAQQGGSRVPAAPAQTSAAPVNQSGGTRATMLDEQQVSALRTVAERDPKNAAPRAQLANLYFDAERYDDAIKWYEDA